MISKEFVAWLLLLLSLHVKGYATPSDDKPRDAVAVLQLLIKNSSEQRPMLMEVDCRVLVAEHPVDTDRHITLKVFVDKNKVLYSCDDRRPGQSGMPHNKIRWSSDGKHLRRIRSSDELTHSLGTQDVLPGTIADSYTKFPGIVGDLIDPRLLGYSNTRLMLHSMALLVDGRTNLEDLKSLATDTGVYETSVTESILEGRDVLLVSIRTREGEVAADERSPVGVSIYVDAESMLPLRFSVVTANSAAGLNQPDHALVQESHVTWEDNESSKCAAYPKSIVYQQRRDGVLEYHEEMKLNCMQGFEWNSAPDELFDWAGLDPQIGQLALFDGEKVMRSWDGSKFGMRNPIQNTVTSVPPERSRRAFWWLVVNVLALPFVLLYIIKRKMARSKQHS